MPRDLQALLFVGIKNAVLALDAKTGVIMWTAELKTSDYVNVLWDGEALFASNKGEVWRLDPASGAEIWRNQLKGMGRGLVSLASSRVPNTTAMTDQEAGKRLRDARAAAAAAAAG
jgi:outer membrane protein assembly factor BamB